MAKTSETAYSHTPWGAFLTIAAVKKAGTGRLAKEAILEQNRKNRYLVAILKWAYSDAKFYCFPDKETASTKKVSKPKDKTGVANWEKFDQLLKDLSSRRITGNKAARAVSEFFENPSLFAREARVYAAVMEHDLDIGVAKGTIKKIWPEIYHVEAKVGSGKPVYKGCQSCPTEVIDVDFPFEYPIRAEYKYDGMRVTFVSDSGQCLGFTRNGKTYEPMTVFSDVFATLPGWVFSCELFYRNFNDSGIFRRKHPLTAEERKDVSKLAVCKIVDLIPLEDYYATGGTHIPFKLRLEQSKKLVKKLGDPRIKVMYGREINNRDELHEFLTEAILKNHEGLVTKELDKGSKPKRCNSWRKLKPTKDRTVVIVKVVEGKDKYKGTFGAFVVRDPKRPQDGTFNVGSGCKLPTGESTMPDAERDRLWKIRHKLPGRLIDVVEQEEKKGKRKSMYARYKGFRDDLSIEMLEQEAESSSDKPGN